MSRYTQAASLASRLEAQALDLRCRHGVPINERRAATIARRYRIVMNALMAESRRIARLLAERSAS